VINWSMSNQSNLPIRAIMSQFSQVLVDYVQQEVEVYNGPRRLARAQGALLTDRTAIKKVRAKYESLIRGERLELDTMEHGLHS
jgi:hypothetical protein